ncbi:MAG: pyruvate kinase [Acidimicrobiales bacterium]
MGCTLPGQSPRCSPTPACSSTTARSPPRCWPSDRTAPCCASGARRPAATARRGINVPDAALDVCAHREGPGRSRHRGRARRSVALSFVRTPGDVRLLLEALAELDATHLGVVLKIENERAFAALPHLLRAAMVHDGVGVMIARGDLAVEVGYERMAELQEEISGCANRPTSRRSGPPRCSTSWPKGRPCAFGDHRRRHGASGGVRNAQQKAARHRCSVGAR